jgi:hypothetical protein
MEAAKADVDAARREVQNAARESETKRGKATPAQADGPGGTAKRGGGRKDDKRDGTPTAQRDTAGDGTELSDDDIAETVSAGADAT